LKGTVNGKRSINVCITLEWSQLKKLIRTRYFIELDILRDVLTSLYFIVAVCTNSRRRPTMIVHAIFKGKKKKTKKNTVFRKSKSRVNRLRVGWNKLDVHTSRASHSPTLKASLYTWSWGNDCVCIGILVFVGCFRIDIFIYRVGARYGQRGLLLEAANLWGGISSWYPWSRKKNGEILAYLYYEWSKFTT